MNPRGFQSDKGWTGKQAKRISTCQTRNDPIAMTDNTQKCLCLFFSSTLLQPMHIWAHTLFTSQKSNAFTWKIYCPRWADINLWDIACYYVYPAPTKVLQNLIVIHKADKVYFLKPTYHADLVLDNYNYPTRPFEHICIGSIILFHSCYQLLQRYP